MDRPVVLGFDLFQVVESLAEHIEQATQRGLTYGHCYRRAGVDGLRASLQTIRPTECETADPVVPDVLLDFEHQALAVELRVQRV